MNSVDVEGLEYILDSLETDIDLLEPRINSWLQQSPDSRASKLEPPEKAVPYAVSAYALSSLVFAYLKSEGRDTAIVMPELERIKNRLDALNKANNSKGQAAERTNSDHQESSTPRNKSGTKHNTHIRFSDHKTQKKRHKSRH